MTNDQKTLICHHHFMKKLLGMNILDAMMFTRKVDEVIVTKSLSSSTFGNIVFMVGAVLYYIK